MFKKKLIKKYFNQQLGKSSKIVQEDWKRHIKKEEVPTTILIHAEQECIKAFSINKFWIILFVC